MRALMRSMLDDMAEVHECCSGVEAVAAYFQMHPDWVLMDLQMPNGDGLTATRAIRARDIKAKIAIVTQFDQEEFRRAAAEAGASAFVLKDNLLEIRRTLLSDPA
jgi:CheY-like chemotaxis protein